MILLFPNYDTLRLALTSSIVSTEVTLAPAAVSFDEHGKIYLESTTSLSKTTTKNLDKIGVKGSKRHASEHPEAVTCWPQIVPLVKESGTPEMSNQAPVLFELSNADDLPTLVTEMLRLGNDRQSFRWFTAPDAPDSQRVLLRVIGPPYYTLLRALDPSAAGTAGTVRAYLERSPRLWIELGYNHPLSQQIRVADSQVLLLRSPRQWIYLDETPFQDVYDVLQFKLPHAPVGWTESTTTKKMSVPLRLAAGNAADVPELWVLRDNAIDQLDTLVRDSDERLTQRLKFAVATSASGQRSVILRTKPSKLPPPALPLEDALGFKPFWKLPNLFVPVGRRLHPTLRRDAVRKLLADDPDQVVWLYPGAGNAFTPESVPDGAFRSLEDWVDYVIETEQEPLAAWIGATRFDFDHFVCTDTSGPKPKPDRGDKEKSSREDADDGKGLRGGVAAPKGPTRGKSAGPKASGPVEFLPETEAARPQSEWVKRREELEEQFKAVEGGLDAPERVALWPELAVANAHAGNARSEAAICWLNAMWGTDPIPPQWVASWIRTEIPDFKGMKADEFDKRLARPDPGPEDARVVIAGFLWLASQHPVPAWLPARLAAVGAYLDRHWEAFSVRAVWLVAHRLSQLAGTDVLGLARVRDRLLQRLLEQGLTAERDLPLFLRVAGMKDTERLRVLNEKALDLHATIREWSAHIPTNLPYIALLFAFAMAKMGESSKARKLMDDARRDMEVPIPSIKNDRKQDDYAIMAIIKNVLYKAFKFRIEQVLANKPATGQLGAELIAEINELSRKGRESGAKYTATGPTLNPYTFSTYVIERMREQSHILDPQEKIHPYAEFMKGTDPLARKISEITALHNPIKLADEIRAIQKNDKLGRPLKEVQFLSLHALISLSARVGEAFTIEMLQQVPTALSFSSPPGTPESVDLPQKQGELMERALFLAGHFDRGELAKKLINEFTDLIRSKPDEARFKLINVVAGQCLRSLKKLGMRDEMDRFLGKLRTEALRGASLAELKKKYLAKPELWGMALQTLQNLATGWLTFGLHDQARPLLEEARNELLNPDAVKLDAKLYVQLACAYVTACGQCPSDEGLARITELFHTMEPSRIINTFTTSQHYSRFHLNLVEAVIQAIVTDEHTLGLGGRRWLDDDEYLVRRRIHADMKRERVKSGL